MAVVREHVQQAKPVSPAAEKVKAVRRRNGMYFLDNDEYTSVTTILSCLARPALIYWAAKTAAGLVLEQPDRFDTAEAAAGGIYAVRDKAADRGSLIHSLAEAFARQGAVEVVPDAIKGYADAFWSWVNVAQPTPLFTESNVYNRTHRYGGTLDLLVALPDKSLVIVDFKTSPRVYDEVELQLAAYRNAEFIVPHLDATQRIPMPTVSKTACVLLRENGTFAYEELNGDFSVFLHLKAVHDWQRGKK